MLECATDLHANDSKLFDESVLSNKTLIGIKEVLSQHHDFVSDVRRQAGEKLEKLENLDEPVALTMKKLGEEREAAVQYIAGTVVGSSDQGFDNLASKRSSQTKFMVEEMIPGVDKAFQELTNEQNRMYGDVSNELMNHQQTAGTGYDEVKSIIMKQVDEVDQLRDTVNSQRTEFETKIIAPRKLNIESRHEALLEEIENHHQAVNDQLSTSSKLLTQVKEDVNSFAVNVIHVFEEVPENEPRTKIPFSDKLSSTPSRQNIIANLNNSCFPDSKARFPDENNKMYINTYDSGKESRDDVKVIRLDAHTHRDALM